ncbi:MAG: flippase activity-associated protein Agl23 [Planctomycetota bacterium]
MHLKQQPGLAKKRIPLWLFMVSAVTAIAIGLGLRFIDLDRAPIHADEAATGAKILAERLESQTYRFDPRHFHGPLLTATAVPIAKLRGENDWDSLTKTTLRITTAAAGALTVFLVVLIAPRSRVYALSVAALIATSPLLVYFSRIFIHESWQVLGATGLIVAATAYISRPSALLAGLAGLSLGVMFANKETAVITLMSWGIASVVLIIESRRVRRYIAENRSLLMRHGLIGSAAVFIIIGMAYTGFGRDFSGLVSFGKTYFVYEADDSHKKSFFYYAYLLAWPKQAGGFWWGETLVFITAVGGFCLSLRDSRGMAIRVIAYAAMSEWLIYSLIGYKTPWLAAVFWLELCCVAGYGISRLFISKSVSLRWAACVFLISVTSWHATQAYRVALRFPVDDRNPYAYVPTSPDVEKASRWLGELAAEYPEIAEGPLAVVGREYWPLPWYLRDFDTVGYWPEVPEIAHGLPLVLLLPNHALDTAGLDETHYAVPRSLRTDTPMWVYVRRDIWQNYLSGRSEP